MVAKRKINEIIFINLYSRAEDFPMFRKGLFWLLWISDEESERAVKNLWSHFGIITIYCSWMIFEFFIWTNKHKNMFLYFHFHGNDFFFSSSFFSEKLERNSSQFFVSPSWMKWTFHCCPFLFARCGWSWVRDGISFPLSGQRVFVFPFYSLCA